MRGAISHGKRARFACSHKGNWFCVIPENTEEAAIRRLLDAERTARVDREYAEGYALKHAKALA